MCRTANALLGSNPGSLEMQNDLPSSGNQETENSTEPPQSGIVAFFSSFSCHHLGPGPFLQDAVHLIGLPQTPLCSISTPRKHRDPGILLCTLVSLAFQLAPSRSNQSILSTPHSRCPRPPPRDHAVSPRKGTPTSPFWFPKAIVAGNSIEEFQGTNPASHGSNFNRQRPSTSQSTSCVRTRDGTQPVFHI